MVERRVVFRINRFIEDLSLCLSEDNIEDVDDTLERYRDFLYGAEEGLKNCTINYIDNHPLVVENKEIRSYIESCYE